MTASNVNGGTPTPWTSLEALRDQAKVEMEQLSSAGKTPPAPATTPPQAPTPSRAATTQQLSAKTSSVTVDSSKIGNAISRLNERTNKIMADTEGRGQKILNSLRALGKWIIANPTKVAVLMGLGLAAMIITAVTFGKGIPLLAVAVPVLAKWVFGAMCAEHARIPKKEPPLDAKFNAIRGYIDQAKTPAQLNSTRTNMQEYLRDELAALGKGDSEDSQILNGLMKEIASTGQGTHEEQQYALKKAMDHIIDFLKYKKVDEQLLPKRSQTLAQEITEDLRRSMIPSDYQKEADRYEAIRLVKPGSSAITEGDREIFRQCKECLKKTDIEGQKQDLGAIITRLKEFENVDVAKVNEIENNVKDFTMKEQVEGAINQLKKLIDVDGYKEAIHKRGEKAEEANDLLAKFKGLKNDPDSLLLFLGAEREKGEDVQSLINRLQTGVNLEAPPPPDDDEIPPPPADEDV